jgi:hypothetical protein
MLRQGAVDAEADVELVTDGPLVEGVTSETPLKLFSPPLPPTDGSVPSANDPQAGAVDADRSWRRLACGARRGGEHYQHSRREGYTTDSRRAQAPAGRQP